MADIETLGSTVATLSKTFASQLEASHFPKPSFAADSPAIYPPKPEIQEPRLQLIDALTDLLNLATGAGDYLFLQGGLLVSTPERLVFILKPFLLVAGDRKQTSDKPSAQP